MVELQDSNPLPVPRKAQFRAKTSKADLEPILSWFAQLYQPPIPSKVWLQCQLALAEGFTNAVKYANKGLSPDVPIDIEVTMEPEHLEIRIWDYGAPFDLEKKLYEMSQEKKDPYADHGRGLKLMQDIADTLSYQQMPDQRNCLLIVKNYWPSPEDEA